MNRCQEAERLSAYKYIQSHPVPSFWSLPCGLFGCSVGFVWVFFGGGGVVCLFYFFSIVFFLVCFVMFRYCFAKSRRLSATDSTLFYPPVAFVVLIRLGKDIVITLINYIFNNIFIRNKYIFSRKISMIRQQRW